MRFRDLSCATSDVLQVTPTGGCRCADCRFSRLTHAVSAHMHVYRQRGRSLYVALTVDLGTPALSVAYDAVEKTMLHFNNTTQRRDS